MTLVKVPVELISKGGLIKRSINQGKFREACRTGFAYHSWSSEWGTTGRMIVVG